MMRTLELVLRVAAVPVGVGVGLWIAQLTTISSTYQCVGRCLPRSLFPMAIPTFALWQCALFGAGAVVVVLLLSFAVARLPSARSLKAA